jgi:drug/metabolite transporter (DMT)-like permease
MSWIVYVVVANIFFGVSSVFDKYLNSKKIRTVYAYSVLLNLIYLIYFSITAFFIFKTFVLNSYFYWAVLGGCIYFVMWLIFWQALKTVEVSRASALFFTQPVFTAIMASLFLNESLGPSKWLAVVLIVMGAILSSWESKKTKFNKGYLLVLLAALLSALGNTVAKYAMSGLPSLTVNTIGFFGTIPLYIILLMQKDVLKEVSLALRDLTIMKGFAIRGTIGYVAICLFMLGVGAGPVSLVVALSGTQPIFTLVVSLLAGSLMPKMIKEETNRSALLIKTTAIILIVVGAIIISL